ncbi:hypothetical protein [Streptomyces sp. NPDC088707]|uniref:hypothetical protein n=1 Tax=Streptomyces sp. NPDC088707 TaxID=3365871 RepID=UPI00382E6E04
MSDSIRATALRLGREWVVQVPEHGVYSHGTTLKRARASVAEGLALVGVTAEVTLIAESPELERLRAADAARMEALTVAVSAFLLRRTSLSDIALATGEPVRVVKSIIAEHRLKPSAEDVDAAPNEPAQLRTGDLGTQAP